ncbi:MAG: PIN domain-containing protein [Geodermatophilaceae bacterium]
MIGLDTNVVIRYVAQDDVAQAAVATQVFESLSESNQGHVSTVVLVEIDWVLRQAYGADRTSAAGVLQGLLESREINLEKPDALRRALTRVASGADFADALISELGNAAGCVHTVTFDRAAARSAGMRLLLPT